MPKKIKSLEKKGIRFSVSHVIEIFPSPLPSSDEDQEIICESDLFRSSHIYGYDELYLHDTDIVKGVSEGKGYQFTLNDFVQWQLERMDAITIYHLIGKTNAYVQDILDEEAEYEKDEDYNPSMLLNGYGSEEYLDKSLTYIDRLKNESPDEFYKCLIGSILDENFGLLNPNWYESEIDENLDEIREAYSHWNVPLMVVSTGKFLPFIDTEYTNNLLMEEYNLKRMYIRNYDEGDKS